VDEPSNAAEAGPGLDFIRERVRAAVRAGKHGGHVRTRFPPEPNGYLHVGHAKSICLNFDVANELGGECNLRFDDTNPATEEEEFVDAIQADIEWLGFRWDRKCFASDYFDQLYEWAVHLVKTGKAYVDSLSAEQIQEYRGPWNEPGRESPFRNRSAVESLDLLARMKAGEFADGQHVLRARIDMASGNMNLRDPILYRIRHASHHRTGDRWCIYPSYDFAHGQSDAIEGITHSICTLEFEDHRPLYDWLLENLPVPHRPEQIEFARLILTYTVVSKRKLRQLVEEGHVKGWDDPRMPTLRGMRRRGFTPESIREMCRQVGVTKNNSLTDYAVLDYAIRNHLNQVAPRRMAVLDPLKVVIENYPEGVEEELEAVNNPEDAGAGTRLVPFSRELYIERDDFLEDPPRKFFRLAPGREVRLRYAYFVTCHEVVKDGDGKIVELRCTYDPATRGGSAPDGRKVGATLHWVSAKHAVEADVRLYDRLFSQETPGRGGRDFLLDLNPDSLRTITARVEPGLAGSEAGYRCQFERIGYFCVDSDSSEKSLVFNRIVTLKDAWAKVQQKSKGEG
jgi:glutaminyl-tRNA synthetase